MTDAGTPETELGHFLAELRKLRERAGQPSLRAMARTAHYSHTALSGVVAGGRLPSLDLTLAFVRACGGDEDAWRARWHRVHSQIVAAAGDTAVDPPARRQRRLRRAAGVAGVAAAAAAIAVTAVIVATSGGVVATNRGSLHAHDLGKSRQAPAACPARPDSPDHPLVPCDDSRFVADVTIPDGTTVRANQRFVKVWEIQDTGLVPWRGRYLQRQGIEQGPGLCSSPARVRVPTTMPGQDALISVAFTAPNLPGSCRVDWKMTDEQGRLYFPDRAGLYVTVNVTG